MPLGESHETCQEPMRKENNYSSLKENMRKYIFKEIKPIWVSIGMKKKKKNATKK